MGPFLVSAHRVGLNPVILGYGQPFLGYGNRLKVVREALRQVRGKVLFTDAYDVVFARQPELPNGWMVSGERNCYPYPERADWFQSDSSYRYPNAGVWGGDAEYILEILDEQEIEDGADDQALLQELCVRLNAILVDEQCSQFQSLWGSIADLELIGAGIRNKLTNTYPAVIHGNGQSDMREVRRWLKL